MKPFFRRFKFENCWLEDPDVTDVVIGGWNKDISADITSKVQHWVAAMDDWGRHIRCQFRSSIKEWRRQLEELRGKTDETSISLYHEVKAKINDALMQEDNYWRQRSKAYWLKDGDKNTNLFMQ